MSHSCSILSASNVSSGVRQFSSPDGVQLWNLWALTLKLRMFLSSWKWLVGIKCSYSTQKRQFQFFPSWEFQCHSATQLENLQKLLGISEVGRILEANGLTYYLHHLWFCWMALSVSSSGWHPWPVAMSSWPRSRVCWIEGLIKNLANEECFFFESKTGETWWDFTNSHWSWFGISQPVQKKNHFISSMCQVFLHGRVRCLFISSVFKGSDFERFRPGHPLPPQWIPCDSHDCTGKSGPLRFFGASAKIAFGAYQRKKTNWNI